MMNTMPIGGQRAVIQFDPEIGMFRGECVGSGGGAWFAPTAPLVSLSPPDKPALDRPQSQ